MNAAGKNPAAIISKRVIPSHQISSVLQHHGWVPRIFDQPAGADEIRTFNPKVLVADIDDAACNGLEILQWFRRFNPVSYTIALCAGGCSPAMRAARHIGVNGFFYLNNTGLSLDPNRGLMRVFTCNRKTGSDHAHAFQPASNDPSSGASPTGY